MADHAAAGSVEPGGQTSTQKTDANTLGGEPVATAAALSRCPKARRLAALTCAFVVFHLVMTTGYLLHRAPTPMAVRSAIDSYMEPVFKQSWSVFAPDPVSYNTYFSVRAQQENGVTTDWFDVSSCDVDAAVKHHAVPNRRYLTTFQLMRHYRAGVQRLPERAQLVAAQDTAGDWAAVDRHLVSVGATHSEAASYVKNARATVALASQIARSRWGAISVVQIEVKKVPTRRSHTREGTTSTGGVSARRKDAVRTDTWRSGFNPAVSAPAASQDAVDALYAPKAGC